MNRIRFTYRNQDCIAIRYKGETEALAVARSIRRREPRVHGVSMRQDSTAADGSCAVYEARLDGASDKFGSRPFRNVWVTIYR